MKDAVEITYDRVLFSELSDKVRIMNEDGGLMRIEDAAGKFMENSPKLKSSGVIGISARTFRHKILGIMENTDDLAMKVTPITIYIDESGHHIIADGTKRIIALSLLEDKGDYELLTVTVSPNKFKSKDVVELYHKLNRNRNISELEYRFSKFLK